jgi:hypothetical protein
MLESRFDNNVEIMIKILSTTNGCHDVQARLRLPCLLITLARRASVAFFLISRVNNGRDVSRSERRKHSAFFCRQGL